MERAGSWFQAWASFAAWSYFGRSRRTPLRNCQGAVRRIESFNTDNLAIQHAAEIPGYDPLQYFTAEEVACLDRTAQFGILAARRAVEDAGLSQAMLESERTALVTGVCAGGQVTRRKRRLTHSISIYTASPTLPFLSNRMRLVALWDCMVHAVRFRQPVHPVVQRWPLHMNGSVPGEQTM